MPSITELQKRYDEISEIRQAVKSDWSVSNARKREIAYEYRAAGNELRAASKAVMAANKKIWEARNGKASKADDTLGVEASKEQETPAESSPRPATSDGAPVAGYKAR